MAFKKTFSSNNMEPLGSGQEFAKGVQFVRDGKKWEVVDSFVSDNTPMRKIVATDGLEEIVMLYTLIKDMESNSVHFIKHADFTSMNGSATEQKDDKIKKNEEERIEMDSESPIEVDLEADENKHKFHKKF